MKKIFLLLVGLSLLIPTTTFAHTAPNETGPFYQEMNEYMDKMMDGELTTEEQRALSGYFHENSGYYGSPMTGFQHMTWGMNTPGSAFYWIASIFRGIICVLILSLLIQVNIYLWKKIRR